MSVLWPSFEEVHVDVSFDSLADSVDDGPGGQAICSFSSLSFLLLGFEILSSFLLRLLPERNSVLDNLFVDAYFLVLLIDSFILVFAGTTKP